MKDNLCPSQELAANITRKASKQTYYTIRFLVDRNLVADAYRAYGYYRWVDDILDAPSVAYSEKITFLERQRSILDACYRGETLQAVSSQEQMLVDLVRNDREANSGLQEYLRNMMEVMSFDTQRSGSFISQGELTEYSHRLAVAVTEALHYFIGHKIPVGLQKNRYLAVTAAHIVHMLRDTKDDFQVGYHNFPIEHFHQESISLQDVDNQEFRNWVKTRIELAHQYFKAGCEGLRQDRCLRRRLACYAYVARFELLIKIIQKDGYFLRQGYSSRKSLSAGLWMGWRLFESLVGLPLIKGGYHNANHQRIRINE